VLVLDTTSVPPADCAEAVRSLYKIYEALGTSLEATVIERCELLLPQVRPGLRDQSRAVARDRDRCSHSWGDIP
jgi:phosphate uptake regulator